VEGPFSFVCAVVFPDGKGPLKIEQTAADGDGGTAEAANTGVTSDGDEGATAVAVDAREAPSLLSSMSILFISSDTVSHNFVNRVSKGWFCCPCPVEDLGKDGSDALEAYEGPSWMFNILLASTNEIFFSDRSF
jgi:hypothetical protein